MKKFLDFVLIALGGITIAAGVVTFWLPLPIGIPLIMIGMPVLLKYSPSARQRLISLTKSYPKALSPLRRFIRKKR